MEIRYYLDPESDTPHIYHHDVSESEIEEVFSRPGEDRSGRDGSRILVGRTFAGRILRVIYVPGELPNSAFVITAYELTGKPLIAYRRRRRRHL